jgi:stage II sporulation SpoE-like protein
MNNIIKTSGSEKVAKKMSLKRRIIHSRRTRLIFIGIPVAIIFTLVHMFCTERQFMAILLAFYGITIAFLMYNFRKSDVANIIITEQKEELDKQKEIIEEKQKEIIDSITYAKRLQQAILPSLHEVKKQLPNSFVYYQPKDIVAGDFYWMHTVRYENRDMSIESSGVSNLTSQYSNLTFIAAADCTGHGVPGAMVSVVCSNALNRAVNEFNLTDTGLILDKTRELVIETFEKSDAEVKDGMDISLMRIENIKGGKKEVQWSGANNSLWYVLNSELIEVKADKQPIGKYSEAKPFTTNNFTFNNSVTFYLFSDGYADQFSANAYIPRVAAVLSIIVGVFVLESQHYFLPVK